jgi:hypothetical protein
MREIEARSSEPWNELFPWWRDDGETEREEDHHG